MSNPVPTVTSVTVPALTLIDPVDTSVTLPYASRVIVSIFVASAVEP